MQLGKGLWMLALIPLRQDYSMPALSFDDLFPKQQQGSALSFDDLVPKQQPDTSFSAGLQHGLTGAGVGFLQTAHDVGKALYGANPHDPAEEQAMNQAAANVGKQEEGTGLIGTAGEMAGNPLNWGPWKSLLAYGGVSGLTAPQTNDTGIGGRLEQGAISAPIAAATGQAAKYLVGKPLQWGANKSGLTDLISQGLQKFGVQGQSGDLYNLAQQAGLDVNGKSPQEIADSLQNWYQSQSQGLAGKVSNQPFNPEDTFKGVAGNWKDEQGAANEAFQAARETGQGVKQQIPELRQKLDAIIGATEGNTLPGTSEHTALQQLKNIRDTIEPEKPFATSIPASTLMDLRANLNEGYNPKLLPERGDVQVGDITKDVGGALENAGKINPQFGEQLQYADARQANLGYSYKNNDLLKKFFKPEDLSALDQNAKSGTPIPDITLKRANALLPSIKTPEDMATLTKAMPAELADSMRAAKVEQLMTKAGFDYQKLTDPKFMALMQKSLGDNPEALAQLGKIQQVADVLNRRNINVMSPQTLQSGNHETGSWIRAAWDLFEHRKAYAVRMAYRALTDEESNALSGLQGEIQKGAPFKNILPEAARQISGRTVGQITNEPSGESQPATGGIGDQNMQELQKLKSTMPQSSNASPVDKFAQAESKGNAQAKNPNSSASGLYQFTDSTWAGMVKKYGKDTGITMGDKNDPAKQQIMARLLAQDNIKQLTPAIGHTPSIPELYTAHVLGASGAARLINAQGSGKQAMMLFPKAVTSANHAIFFNGDQPRTVEQVYQLLASKV